MRVLLDTAVLLFAVETPERLSKRADSILRNPANIRELGTMSISEIAVKTSIGKFDISAADVRQALVDMDIHVLPFTADHAFALFDLPLHHRDPFDRQIIAQALSEGIPVITPDVHFRRYRGLKVIW